MKHVIIGAGAAGISAVKTIRELNKSDEIIVISTDDAVYSRCMLHNYISGERDEKGISFIDDDFFAKNNIRWLCGKTVTKIDTDKRQVHFADGAEPYDKLLIATGAEVINLPPVQSGNPANALGLRHLSDAKEIRERAHNAKDIVIIGAGLVGLDAAYALIGMGKKPTVVDISDSILAINLDPYASGIYKKKFEEAGCTFHLGQKVSGADKDANGNVVSLTLHSGKKLPCDLVIVAIGARPELEFLVGSGITYDYGVTVNQHLATNVDGVYAAGDVTGLSGIWPNAVKQGEVAAKNMCDVQTVYDDMFSLKNTVNYFGIQSLSLGKVAPEEGDTSEMRNSRNKYEKVILRNGVIVGVILQGDIAHSGFWQYLIKNEIDVSKIKHSVFSLSFADFYGIKENGEYEWVV